MNYLISHKRFLATMLSNNSFCRVVLTTWALMSACGCGGKPASVSGTVTLDGLPVQRGTVAFTPVNQGMMAQGDIESDGSYKLHTNLDTGLIPGEYSVRVISREPGVSIGGSPPIPGDYIVPKKYGQASTSGLRFEVASGRNTIDLDLKSEPTG